MPGMSKPILEVSRQNYTIDSAHPENLSFSSGWETPKIFLQTQSSWTNTIGYVPSFLSFRKLNSTDYCHETFEDNDLNTTRGAYVASNGNLTINTRSGDSGMSVIMFFNSIDGTPTNTPISTVTPYITASKDGYDVSAHPINKEIDSRYDTFKIKHTGTLTLTLDAETILAGGSDRTYSTNYEHSLGYPPIYLPVVGKDWQIRNAGVSNTSFVVNDYIGYLASSPSFQRSILNVYVDSSKLYMTYTRKADAYSDRSYDAITVDMYYTIFYNDISEEFNLLT